MLTGAFGVNCERSSARVRLLITATRFRSFCVTALAPEPPNCSAAYLMLETNRTGPKSPREAENSHNEGMNDEFQAFHSDRGCAGRPVRREIAGRDHGGGKRRPRGNHRDGTAALAKH